MGTMEKGRETQGQPRQGQPGHGQPGQDKGRQGQQQHETGPATRVVAPARVAGPVSCC